MEQSVERRDLSNGDELDDDVLDRAVGGTGQPVAHKVPHTVDHYVPPPPGYVAPVAHKLP